MSKLIYYYLNRPETVFIDLFKVTTNKVVVKFFGAYGNLYYTLVKSIYLDFKHATKFYILLQTQKKDVKKFLGLVFALIYSALRDVSLSFRVFLRLRGVGFKVFKRQNFLILEVGFSHILQIFLPSNIFLRIRNRKNTKFVLQSLSKQYISEFAEYIKEMRLPNEYTLKGIHYRNEIIIKKTGKQAQTK